MLRIALLSGMVFCVSVACTPLTEPSYVSHGPGIGGYGPVPFGTLRDAALEIVRAKGGFFEESPDKKSKILKYPDAIDVMPVRVHQHFDEKTSKATKAEVFLLEPERGPKTVEECRGANESLYHILKTRYGAPDWEPRTDAREGGETSTMMYTFANSSSVTLSYHYQNQDSEGRYTVRCTVHLLFMPPWSGGGGD